MIVGGEKSCSQGFPIKGATKFNIAIDYSGLEPPSHIHQALVTSHLVYCNVLHNVLEDHLRPSVCQNAVALLEM